MLPAHGIWRETASLLDAMWQWTSQWMGEKKKKKRQLYNNACCCWSSYRTGIQTFLSHGNQKWNVAFNTYFEQNFTKGKNITGFATGRSIQNFRSNIRITDVVLLCSRKGAVTCFSKVNDVAMFVTHKNIISLQITVKKAFFVNMWKGFC